MSSSLPTSVSMTTNVSSRLGSHSTSDDQTVYQDMDEVQEWQEHYFPKDRLQGYLQARGLWNDSKEQALLSQVKGTFKAAMKRYILGEDCA